MGKMTPGIPLVGPTHLASPKPVIRYYLDYVGGAKRLEKNTETKFREHHVRLSFSKGR